MSWLPVRRYPINAIGRDWVVGDVHGAFDLVWAAMQAAKFDPKCDRLFVVGDMVDRGEQSLRAGAFLNLPYVHAALGNHEAAWLELYEDGPPDDSVVEAIESTRFGMGARWWLAAEPRQRDALVAKFAELPLAIEVETERGLVGIVHADVPAGLSWQEFTAALAAGDKHVVKTALWGRSRLGSANDDGVPGIDRVFVGHTPQWTGPKRLGNVYAVDTGAIYGLQTNGQEPGHLTMAQLVASTASLSKAAENVLASGLLDLKDECGPMSAGFGQYARLRAQ